MPVFSPLVLEIEEGKYFQLPKKNAKKNTIHTTKKHKTKHNLYHKKKHKKTQFIPQK